MNYVNIDYDLPLQRRCKALAAQGLLFVGSGVSGGEDGARYGPSLMPGGAEQAWYVHLYRFRDSDYMCCQDVS